MSIAHLLQPHSKDISPGFTVRRTLPAAARQAVGPFLFFDHFGPITAQPGDNHDVRPHPHIGLATVTYLFEGAMLHRDSLGVVQRIEPGAINWMTAGSGIVHSERTPPELANTVRRSHGLQLWVGLPKPHEEAAPSFAHTPVGDIPVLKEGGATVRVLVGELRGVRSPVATLAPTLYLDVDAGPGSTFVLPGVMGDCRIERAVYSVDHAVTIDGVAVEPYQLAVIEPGADARIDSPQGARYVVIGGEPLDGHRFMWWNFVSSRKERIEEAKRAWAEQKMGQVFGETEWIPLP